MSRGLRPTSYLAACLLCCFAAGCGGGSDAVITGTISGKITNKGKALTAGQVNFSSEKTGAGAFGNLKEDGTYKIDGAIPVGSYRVFITPFIDLDATPPPGQAR